MQVLLAMALDRVAQIGAVHLDLAEQVGRRGQDLGDLEAAVEGRGLVEDVGQAPRTRLDMDLVPALLPLGAVNALELGPHARELRSRQDILDSKEALLVQLLLLRIGERRRGYAQVP